MAPELVSASHHDGLPGVTGVVITRDGRRLSYRAVLPPRMSDIEAPAAVFVSGMGASALGWLPVLERVGEHAVAIGYDRAGIGGSDDDAAPRTLARMAEDLQDLLHALELKRVVLVGHSWGGPIARLCAEREPDAVIGMVLVDPSDEHVYEHMAASTARTSRALQLLLPLVARSGAYRLLGRRFSRLLPDPIAREYLRQDYTSRAIANLRRENSLFRDELSALRLPAEAKNARPVVILSGTRPASGGPMRRQRQMMLDAHKQSVSSRRGWRHVCVPDADHHIHLQNPQRVATETIAMLREAAGEG